jgi:hypothetical protein
MTPLTKGTRVVHPTRKDWGIGEVLEEPKNNTIRVFFVGAGEKALRIDFVALELLQGDAAKNILLDNLDRSLRFRPIDSVILEFTSKYPGGFQGVKYLGEEREYKVAAHEKVSTDLSENELAKLIESEDFQEAAKRIKRAIRATNLLFTTEAIALNEALNEVDLAPTYTRSLFDLLYGNAGLEERFQSHVKVLDGLKACKWPIATYFLFLRYPEKYLFVKPEPTKNAAECSGFLIAYEPRVNWITYSNVLRFGMELEQRLKANGLVPLDMIDVQSFMWCIAPEKMKGAKRKGKATQREFLRQLVDRFGMNESRLVLEYASAERRGEVFREKNESGFTSEEYAEALIRDAVAKGWLDK